MITTWGELLEEYKNKKSKADILNEITEITTDIIYKVDTSTEYKMYIIEKVMRISFLVKIIEYRNYHGENY